MFRLAVAPRVGALAAVLAVYPLRVAAEQAPAPESAPATSAAAPTAPEHPIAPIDAASPARPELPPDPAAEATPTAEPSPQPAPHAEAPAEEHHHVMQTTVEAAAPTSAASAESIRARDLTLRPYSSPEDILRVVPGLVIAQHQGGGKADQLFLRGFDADHGTDVALFIDGVPINLPSHGHGQGFADLHFLIPETIDRVDVSKGPYFTEYGDFDTAGAVNLRTRRTFGESSVSATYGSFSTYRVLGIASPGMSEGLPWIAAEISGSRGPFQAAEDLQRYNVFAKESLALNANTTLSLVASLYGSQWSSSGQIPLRAVEDGTLDRFGSIDPSEGGQTQRQMLVATLDQKQGNDAFQLTAYGVRYRVRLFSDFTFQLRDPEHFDQIEQNDDRLYTGLNARYRHTARFDGMKLVTTLGAQGRYDSIHTDLWHTQARERLADCFDQGANPCNDARINQSNLAAYVEGDLRVNAWLRIVAGLRADLFELEVDDQRPPSAVIGALANEGAQPTSGVVQRSLVNPKLQVVLRPMANWDVYLDGGGGFHSNDARGVIAARGEGALPRAWGAELGTRVRLFDRLDFATSLWGLYLESEQVFSADEDTTEPSGATRRYGVDFELRYQLLPWLWADGDLTLAHAAYAADPTMAVALAPTRTAALGLSALHPDGYKGRIGVRHVGDRPATEDGSLTAEGYTLVDVTLGYRHKFWEVGLTVENLFNAKWREAQFANASQLREAPYNETEPVTDIHFTPGSPINVRATVSLYY